VFADAARPEIHRIEGASGLIWQEAFETGRIRCPIFTDGPDALRGWKNTGRMVAIYSSGSMLAQKLVFRYSEAGDLTDLIAQYFDTPIGHKKTRQAILTLRAAWAFPRSDSVSAGRSGGVGGGAERGLEPRLCIRPGNAPVADGRGLGWHTFFR
jgi:enolase-phosphatase E1